jgi:hypothetical protein
MLASQLLIALSMVVSVASDAPQGWRITDRFAAFRFEARGEYDRRKFAVAVRDKADQLSGFGA